MEILNKTIRGKLVGIISHIEELKSEIDKKIIVEKNGNMGSKIKIEI